ncbi:MAG: formylglycine-generating enzyme family protein [Fuerstiella sp.]|nr:formylglycine-generating enzyme family protein [Fuerstiella sp.]MCP4859117.1 formylglycine-generating enzyme family protein [Fuerstiella sp.]
MKLTALVIVYVAVVCGVSCAAEPARNYTETFTDKQGEELRFDMVLIEGGDFIMGSKKSDRGHQTHEAPAHKVVVKPFYLCSTETTLSLFLSYYLETNQAKASHEATLDTNAVDAITGPTPVFGDLSMGYSKQNPAIGVTWHNAVNFCKWLNRKTGRTYRLPTEAEWEYAARAGGSGPYGRGHNPGNPDEFAWFVDNSDGEPHPVALKKPNAWGLYDMSGNVREWVSDFYDPAAYRKAGAPDKSRKLHAVRGGAYDSEEDGLRCAARGSEEQWWRDGDPQIPKSIWWLPEIDVIGFRLARSAVSETTQNPSSKDASNN